MNEIEEYLKRITVKITANDKWGAGIIISNKHILTCYHIIECCVNNVSSIKIERLVGGSILKANKIIHNERIDCAIIEVDEEFGANDIGRLGKEYNINNIKDEFYSIGFALQNNGLEYIHASGEIKGTVGKNNIDLLQIDSQNIDKGMSGAPVYNTRTKRVIGIISEHLETYRQANRDFSLAIPISTIINNNINDEESIIDIVKHNVERYKIDSKLKEFLEYQTNYFTKENPDGKKLQDYYVPNDLVKVEIDTWDKDEVYGDEWSIEEFLDEDNRFIIIAADFGTGKTSYCYNIAYKLSEDYLNNAEGYIPILVELKNGFSVYNNESLDDILNNNVIEFNKEDKILLIFDGLDEYNDTIYVLEKIKNIKKSNKNIKIILTTRLVKEYYDIFIRAEESVNHIGIQKYYVRIKPFNKEQVNKFFKKYLKIEKIEGKKAYKYFIDLGLNEVCKPLFAYMLARIYNLDAKTFKKIDKDKLKDIEEEARHRILRTIIYHNFTRSLLRGKFKELSDNDELYNEEKELLRILAAISNIYDGEIKDVKEKLETISKNYDRKALDKAREALKNALDIVITSYFRENKETIRFIHKSFQEYFLAEYYYKMICDNKTDMLNVGLPTEECIDFLHGIIDIAMNYKDMLKEHEDISKDDIEKITDTLNSVLRDDIVLHEQMLKDVNDSRKISIKDYSRLLAYKWIAASILSWLSRTDDSKFSSNIKDNLVEIIRLSSKVMPHYLKNLSRVDLSEANLSEANLSYANLSYANLIGAELSRADLYEAYLIGADLSEAKLSRADLYEAYLSRAELSRADLSGAYLIGADLSEAKLYGAELSRADLSGAYLIGADLSEAKLYGAKLSRADLSETKLTGAKLYGAYLYVANLTRAKLSYATLSYATLSKAYLSEADLTNTDFYGAKLSEADISRANLSYAKLSRADLSRANLSEADISYTDLSGAYLFRTNLSEAKFFSVKLYGATLTYANLTGANLVRADLSRANLIEANLVRADLSETKLYGANLVRADLSRANLIEANLVRADLSETKLYGANLSETKLTGANLTRANLSYANLSYANLSGTDLSRTNITNVIFYLFSWKNKDIHNSNLANYLEFYGINIQEYRLTRNDKITLTKDNSKITIELEDNKAILTIDNDELKLDVIKEDNQTKIFIPIKVDEDINTKGIILTYSNDKESIKKALSNLHPNLREIVLRDNLNYKEIWDESIN